MLVHGHTRRLGGGIDGFGNIMPERKLENMTKDERRRRKTKREEKKEEEPTKYILDIWAQRWEGSDAVSQLTSMTPTSAAHRVNTIPNIFVRVCACVFPYSPR